MDVLKDDGTEKKFVEMMKKIANDPDPELESLEDGSKSRWGWGAHPSPRKDPKLDRWIRGFRKVVQDNKDYLKEAVRLSKFMLGDKLFQKIPWIMETNSKHTRQCQNHRMTRVQFRHQNSRKILFSSKPAMFVVPSVIIHEKNVATTLNRTHPKKNISSTPLK